MEEDSLPSSPVKSVGRQSGGDSSSGCSAVSGVSADVSTLMSKSTSSSVRGARMRHPYMLHVRLHSGISLVARDSNGSSDPFVKFKLGSKALGKSRVVNQSLNPQWEQDFQFKILEQFEHPLEIKVYDKDRLGKDYMGRAILELTRLPLGQAVKMELQLEDETGRAPETYLGALRLTFQLVHRSITTEDGTGGDIDGTDNIDSVSSVSSGISSSVTANGSGHQLLQQGRSMAAKLQLQPPKNAFKSMLWNVSVPRPGFLNRRTHTALIFINVIEGSNLLPMDDNGLSDPFVKFKMLPDQKYKTKVCKSTLNPRWLECFEFKLFYDADSKVNNTLQQLDITVWDYDVAGKNDFMGRSTLSVKDLDREKTHVIHQHLEDSAGHLTLLITISGMTEDNAATDLYFSKRGRDDIINRYGLLKTFDNLDDIGWCRVKVLRAQGLPKDAEAFCVLELINTRLQTHTERKNSSPEWNKAFVFNVTDIHAVLEISVLDVHGGTSGGDVGDGRRLAATGEVLGRISLPLLRVRNGEQRWFALKDKSLMRRVHGGLLLEVDVIYNPIRAALRTINPRERRYMKPEPKFRISTMRRNVDRFIGLVEGLLEVGNFVASLWSWENPVRSLLALVFYLVAVWNFEPYMLPLTLVTVLLANKIYHTLQGYFLHEHRVEFHHESTESSAAGHEYEEFEYEEDLPEDSDKSDREEGSKGGLGEKIKQVQTYLVLVQQYIHSASSTLERMRNTFQWAVPWLSWMCVIALLIGTLVIYFVPLRLLFLLWGINKFTKQLTRPWAIDNNELLDFLSRAPSDVDLQETRDVRPDLSEKK